MIAYFGVFNLQASGPAEITLMIVNPIGFTATCFAILLFIRRTSLFYLATLVLSILANFLLYLNILYYREFTDFITIDTMTGGAGMFQHGFDFGSIPLHLMDWIYWIDLVVIIILMITKKIKLDQRAIPKVKAFTIFSLGLAWFGLNFWAGDSLKHQLILRRAQSNKTYVVRYLGLGPWMLTDTYYTELANQQRKDAKPQTMTEVQKYIEQNRYLAPNVKMFGTAKNKNVIEIHLESFQQDLIDLSIKGTDGKEHVVTPFLNSLYHSQQTYAFSNFFNEVGQGKTSDAENMLETSTFGLPAGSLFAKLGSTQTFQAMPAILNQTEGYSSAVFHGNVGAFYNRLNTYKQMGYQNFFDQSFYDNSQANMSPWGIKDKLLFHDSVPELEQLQQPFYVKYLTVTNHLTYTMDKEDEDPNFATVDSGDKLVDGYFETAHYLDQSVQQFFAYLKQSGLYNKSIIVLYGDHYGISGSDLKYYAPYIGIDAKNFNDFDDTMLQRTPFMIVDPDIKNGHISNTYTGEIDVMPTLEHLLGINTQKYIQFGQDMFASGRQNFVALRNGGFVTPSITLTSLNAKNYYNTQTGQPIQELTTEQKAYVKEIGDKVSTMLSMSDKLNNQNLLRFYTPVGFTPINAKNYNYSVKPTEKRLATENKELAAKSTSLLSQNDGKSTLSDYTKDIPEIAKGQDKLKSILDDR
ncbi:LTA synthase family protein [Lactococcus nasutitermitis]|uniref:LTA synthase family protein n=1 Tax=Lactococcus nasutitermitis TaxID=1652957 RepID=A0ABV9JHG2_9LACT|nr:LTA synthase family protein [Lactococcus nasutitermitis]